MVTFRFDILMLFDGRATVKRREQFSSHRVGFMDDSRQKPLKIGGVGESVGEGEGVDC